MQLFTKTDLESLFDSFARMRVLVIGDVMVDAYLWGSVDRISPEAPVPVVAVKRRSSHLGGAANVALNLQGLGAETVWCALIGDDARGNELLRLMDDRSLSTEAMITSNDRVTTTKFRVFGNNAQMLRVDEETTALIAGDDCRKVMTTLEYQIEKKQWDVIIFQDYDKGLITPELINRVCTMAQHKGIPVAVDPKRRHFRSYRGVTLFKPNLKEFGEGFGGSFGGADSDGFREAVTALHQQQEVVTVLITLSSEGVFVSHDGVAHALPAHVRNVADVSGAGDTVISVAALGLAKGLEPVQYAALGNLAGGLVCEEVGVVPVSKRKLREEALKKLCI
jgi:D-glycero-beta-D-manno-heptose-7-phosphate kinase